MEEKSMECDSLREGCIASILSRTTPIDTCKLSLVLTTFYSASQSDTVWNSFLPSDYTSIISRSVSDTSFISNSLSKKSIFQTLSNRPIIIDYSTKSFHLDKKSGKKCYMLGARALSIACGDRDSFFGWTNICGSRFPEVAIVYLVCWLEILGVLNTNALSPNTHYAAYLVFRIINAQGFYQYPVELSVHTFSGQSSQKNAYLNPNKEWPNQDFYLPNVRGDGLLEIEMGNFFNSGLEDEEVYMSVVKKGGKEKNGLIIEGIEVRPKDVNSANQSSFFG